MKELRDLTDLTDSAQVDMVGGWYTSVNCGAVIDSGFVGSTDVHSSLPQGHEGYHESRRCSRDTYPESYITKSTSIREKKQLGRAKLARATRLRQRSVQRFRGGLVFKAHRRLYHSTLGLRVIKKKRILRRRFTWGNLLVFQNLATEIYYEMRFYQQW